MQRNNTDQLMEIFCLLYLENYRGQQLNIHELIQRLHSRDNSSFFRISHGTHWYGTSVDNLPTKENHYYIKILPYKNY